MLIDWQADVALGGSDCEAWRPGLFHQPVNSLSSLATVVALSAMSAGAAEAVLAWHRRQVSARTALLLGGILLAAGVAGLAGRTGSPLCRPHGLLQGHALWHVLTAAALLQWDRIRRARTAWRSRPPSPGG